LNLWAVSDARLADWLILLAASPAVDVGGRSRQASGRPPVDYQTLSNLMPLARRRNQVAALRLRCRNQVLAPRLSRQQRLVRIPQVNSAASRLPPQED